MVSSVPPKTPPNPADLMAQLAAARGELTRAVEASKAMRLQARAEGLYQAARLASDAGDDTQAQALIDEAAQLDKPVLDLKV